MKPINYIKIDEILSRLLDNSLLEGLTKERVVSYLVDFINRTGYYPLYEHREDTLHIEDYRAALPCDVISVDFVKDLKTGMAMRSMTDVYLSKEEFHNKCCQEIAFGDHTWKIQGNVLYTSFKCGDILVSYTTIPVDEDGFPLLIDNSNFLLALEAYIKKIRFGMLFEESKINLNVLQHVEQEYAWATGQLKSEMTLPDMAEMESIKNMYTSMLENLHYFKDGFRTMGGIQDNLKVH